MFGTRTLNRRWKLRFIPKDSTEIQHPDGLGVVYIWTDPKTRACGIAYRGRANKPDWNYTFRDSARRSAHINEWFDGLESRKLQVAEWKAKRAADRGRLDKDYFSAAETAVFVRKALKAAFPAVKFSVTSDTYSGGASVDVRWTDGPLTEDVDAICNLFEGAGFDGMIDLKYSNSHWLLPNGTIYFAATQGTQGSRGTVPACKTEKPHPDARLVHLGADFVQAQRHESCELILAAARYVAEKCQLPELPIDEHGCPSGADAQMRVPYRLYVLPGAPLSEREIVGTDEGEWFGHLVCQVARCLPVDILTGKAVA